MHICRGITPRVGVLVCGLGVLFASRASAQSEAGTLQGLVSGPDQAGNRRCPHHCARPQRRSRADRAHERVRLLLHRRARPEATTRCAWRRWDFSRRSTRSGCACDEHAPRFPHDAGDAATGAGRDQTAYREQDIVRTSRSAGRQRLYRWSRSRICQQIDRNFLDLARLSARRAAAGPAQRPEDVRRRRRTLGPGQRLHRRRQLQERRAERRRQWTDPRVVANPFPENAVKEFRVLTNSFKPEYQYATSAIIETVTQSGGNEWQWQHLRLWRGAVDDPARLRDDHQRYQAAR